MDKATLQKAFLISIALLFAGCAVLTVDVDVYKGPLANHEDIQMEQMAAMAIGAKPLLIELRDILEANYMKTVKKYKVREEESSKLKPQFMRQLEWYGRYGNKDFKTKIRALRQQTWYKPKFVEWHQSEWGTKSYFLDSNADHVNNILFLYENRGNEQYSSFMSRIWQANRDYKIAYNILRPDNNETDIKRWDKLEIKSDNFKDRAKNLLSDNSTPEDINNVVTNIEKLHREYERFCTNKKRDATDLFTCWHAIRDHLGEKEPEELRDNRLLKGKEDELQKSPNAQARAFTETALANFHGEHLFGLKGKKIDDFVEQVKEISQAFLDSRDALERLWQAEMEVIVWLSDKQGKASSDWQRDIYVIAKASLEVIQPRYVTVFLELNALKKDSREDIPKEVDYLSELLPKLTESKLAGGNRSRNWLSSSHYKDAKAIFLAEFIRRPAKMAKGLLACHKYCKSELDPNVLNKSESTKTTSLQYISGWKFGLVRAPFEPKVPEEVFIQRNLTQYTQELGGGAFAGGRLEKGLESLIEDYLNLADEAARGESQERELEASRQILSDALIRYAEKLLFVANNKSLMSPTKTDYGLVSGTVIGSYRLLFGQTFVNKLQDFGWISSSEDTEQYTRILQAVGNSILVQADALHQERKHREQLKGHYDKEIAILEDTVSRMSPIHRNTIGIKPIHKLLPDNATGKDVRDVWIELLEYEHDLALYYGETQRAKEIEGALDAARKKREGMIFIRPAMAYLRTSFPATSLQDNPNLTWDNMLGGHAMRSIPFAPQIGEFLNPDAKRDARINAEIDKQFWQNINRIRVAGGGRTNYAVVKDDIGNWYVKGYSSNPEDIIQSAKNLALFSAGAKMGTPSLVPSTPAEETDRAPETPGSALESILSKHKDDYRRKTQQAYELLREIMNNSENNIRNQIKELWYANDDVNDIHTQLLTALDWSYTHFLEPFAPDVNENENGINKQREQIIEGIRRLKQFRNDLLWKITNVYELEGESSNSSTAGKDVAKSIVRNVVNTQINDLVENRKDAIKTYENALMFLAEATQPQNE